MITTDVCLVCLVVVVAGGFERSFVYRNVSTHRHTSVYAISVPMDIMFINCCKSNRLDSTANVFVECVFTRTRSSECVEKKKQINTYETE